MPRYGETDLMLTPDGDLVLDTNGDLRKTSGADFIKQSVYNCLRSITVDWFYDNIGADLEDFLGRPNSRETAEAMEEQVLRALTTTGLVAEEDLFIKVTPLNRTTIGLFVFVKVPEIEKPIGFQANIDLDGGVSVKYIGYSLGVLS